MARFISPKLNALIRERCYAKGGVTRAQNRLARLGQAIERTEEFLRAAQAEVDRLAAEIKLIAPDLELDQIKTTKKIRPRRWRTGALNDLLIRFLREAPGELTTCELMAKTAKILEVPLTPVENYNRYQESIRRQLARWAVRGFVDRLHDPRGQEEGRWRWRHQGPL